jgi:hypothetical protein
MMASLRDCEGRDRPTESSFIPIFFKGNEIRLPLFHLETSLAIEPPQVSS